MKWFKTNIIILIYITHITTSFQVGNLKRGSKVKFSKPSILVVYLYLGSTGNNTDQNLSNCNTKNIEEKSQLNIGSNVNSGVS